MPFTISHAAAALPLQYLNRTRLRFAALALGCASPDFHYLFHLEAVDRFGHSLAGIFLTCLPVSWVFLLLWDSYGRRGVQALLPRGWHLPPQPIATSFLWTTCAILLGATSHVTWDAFTHDTDWGVRLFPVLETSISLGFRTMPFFKLLQHFSTLFGLAVLGLATWRWARTQPPVSIRELTIRAMLPTVVVGAAALLNGMRFWDAGLRSFLVGGAVAGMLAMGAGVVLYGLLHAMKSAEP